MGTDIHMYAEVRRQGRWLLADPLERNPYWLGDNDVEEDLEPQWIPKSIYSDRNYALFAVLANVRNPIRAVTPFEYLSEPRGLPSDVSHQLFEYFKQVEDWVFSESWLSLQELIEFDWHGKQILRRGNVNPAAAHLFPVGRRRFPFAEWPVGLPIQVADQGDGVEVRWTETYAEAVGDEFLTKTLDILKSYGPSNEVRIVFWFDN